MIDVMNYVSKPLNEVENCLDSQLWHACAGGMVQIPPLNSRVFYFPEGHIEHTTSADVDFGDFSRIPPYILCQVSAIKFMADTDTDEVYAKMKLIPLKDRDFDLDDDGFLGFDHNKNENQEKPASFAKTLTQSDANNGGGFSVPRYCAETIFPRLDYTAKPPVQTIFVKDVHGQMWKFRHIYRGTPRRHLLTTGWSNFVNHKKLFAGDSIVFFRADNGDLCVGIRRAKRGFGGGLLDSPSSGWNTTSAGIGNYTPPSLYKVSGFPDESYNKFGRNGNGDVNGNRKGKASIESVIEAANLAASGRPFEIVYYPRASTPEFCVKASTVKSAMRIQWCPGMRFKMAFETEDSSRISWFMGTISSVQVDDQIHWPNSPWRLIQVDWDEPDLLQNVKRVNPWLVELVSNMHAIHLSPFLPPRKKFRIPQPPDFPLLGQLSMPSLITTNNFFPTGIQGARHISQFGFDHHHPFPFGFTNHDPLRRFKTTQENDENFSCLLTIGNNNPNTSLKKKNDDKKETKNPMFVLFGQPILTEQQLSESCSDGSVVLQNGPAQSPSDEDGPWCKEQRSELKLDTGHCKVFMETDDVGRTLDVAALPSYEELYVKVADMFGLEKSDMLSNLIYCNAAGAVKHTGDEPFSEFSKTARRLTILTDSSSDNMGC